MYLQILIARTLIIPLIYSKFPFLLQFLQIKGKTCQMKVVLINFKLIYNSVDVEKKNSKQFVLFWCKLSKNLRQLTEAAYSSSSLANTASSSDFFSSVNQRLSATRGRRDGNVADEVAILDVLKFPRIYRWHQSALSLGYVKGFEKGRDFPESVFSIIDFGQNFNLGVPGLQSGGTNSLIKSKSLISCVICLHPKTFLLREVLSKFKVK